MLNRLPVLRLFAAAAAITAAAAAVMAVWTAQASAQGTCENDWCADLLDYVLDIDPTLADLDLFTTGDNKDTDFENVSEFIDQLEQAISDRGLDLNFDVGAVGDHLDSLGLDGGEDVPRGDVVLGACAGHSQCTIPPGIPENSHALYAAMLFYNGADDLMGVADFRIFHGHNNPPLPDELSWESLDPNSPDYDASLAADVATRFNLDGNMTNEQALAVITRALTENEGISEGADPCSGSTEPACEALSGSIPSGPFAPPPWMVQTSTPAPAPAPGHPAIPTRPVAAHTFDEAATPGCCTTLPEMGEIVYDYDARRAMGSAAWIDAMGETCCPSLLWHRDDGRRGGGQPDARTFWDDAEAYWWTGLDDYEYTRRAHEANKRRLATQKSIFSARNAAYSADAAAYAAAAGPHNSAVAQWEADWAQYEADWAAADAMPERVLVTPACYDVPDPLNPDETIEVCPAPYTIPNQAKINRLASLDTVRAALESDGAALAHGSAIFDAWHAALVAEQASIAAYGASVSAFGARLSRPPDDPGPHPVLHDASVNPRFGAGGEPYVWGVWVGSGSPSPEACNSALGS